MRGRPLYRLTGTALLLHFPPRNLSQTLKRFKKKSQSLVKASTLPECEQQERRLTKAQTTLIYTLPISTRNIQKKCPSPISKSQCPINETQNVWQDVSPGRRCLILEGVRYSSCPIFECLLYSSLPASCKHLIVY